MIIHDATDGSYPLSTIARQFSETGVPIQIQKMKQMNCRKAAKSLPTGSYVACIKDFMDNFYGMTSYGSRTIIRLAPDTPDKANTTCHEMMHAVTHIGDCVNCKPDESCVWGWLPYLGTFDIAYIRQKLHKLKRK